MSDGDASYFTWAAFVSFSPDPPIMSEFAAGRRLGEAEAWRRPRERSDGAVLWLDNGPLGRRRAGPAVCRYPR
jgi:hypothetical protein